MNRRRFLAAAGAGAALAAGGGLVAIQPRRAALVPDDDARPARTTRRRRVVVVGGGLAGITAALELGERGFDVTLVERGPELGGKLGGWPVQALGETFPQEHGFHGFFAQYYNLRAVMAAAGVADGDLVASDDYPVLYADRPPERFGRTTNVFPLNLLSIVHQSDALRLAAFRNDGPGVWELMRYDPERTFARFDDVDFLTFARTERINRPMVETVLAPFGKTTLNRLERLSAAEAIRFFHFYLLGNPEGLGFQWTRRDSMTAVVAPLRRRLEALGVTVRTGLGAQRLVAGDGGRVTGVALDAGVTPALPVRVERAALAPSGWTLVRRDDGSPVFVTERAGAPVALDGRCTHLGCPLQLDAATGGFRCPCHAGTFDAAGTPTGGPPRRALAPLAATIDGDVVHVAAPASSAEVLACDHCVVACDVRGLRALIAASTLDAPALARDVAALGEADPYVVLRLWLDRPVRSDRRAFYTVSGYRYVDSLAVYSHFQEPFVSWARRTGGAVIELHAYAIAPAAMAPAAALRTRMIAELWHLLPELAGARVLHDDLQERDDFTRWAPGDWARRPVTTTPVANLFLAGDHVRLPVPAALMEAAVVSGRLAANGVLRAEGVRELAIPTVAPRGPLAGWG